MQLKERTNMEDIPKTCRAAVIAEYDKPIEIREVRIPEKLEPKAILARIDVASVCGTDVHLWEGEFGSFVKSLPVIPGHEMAGTIVKLGDGVARDSVGNPLEVGDRIVWEHGSCGECYYCRVTHQPGICSNRKYYIFSNCDEYPYLVGTFAEYCYVFPESGRIRIPDDLEDRWASAASCALRSVIQGFDRLGRIEYSQKVVIQGAGPLGLFSVALARSAGAEKVVLIGAPQARLDVAKAWGADHVVSIDEIPTEKERVQAVRDLTNGAGPDIVIEASGGRTAIREGLEMIRTGGRYLNLGQVSNHKLEIVPSLITRKHAKIIGSWSADISHYWKGLQFMARNKDRYDFDLMISNSYKLNDINEAMENMRAFREIKPLIIP